MSISTELARLAAAKDDIAAEITAKGVTVPTGTKLDGMPELIAQITGGGALINGMPFMAGTFTPAEDLTSEYIIAPPASCAPLMFDGESWVTNRIYNKLLLSVYLTPQTIQISGSQYARLLLCSTRVARYVTEISGYSSSGATVALDAYGSSSSASISSGLGVTVSYNDGLSIVCNSSYKAFAGFEYSWLAMRVIL